MNNNYYQILGVDENAAEIEIKRAYRRLARQFHPDVTQTEEAESLFKEINRAYDILSDSLKRSDYDQTLHPAAEAERKEAPAPGTEEAYGWQPTAQPKEETGSTASRVSATVVVFLLGASAIEFFLRWLFPENLISSSFFYIYGLILGLAAGLIWGVDNNLDLNAILGPTVWGRLFTFLRSLVFTITLTYFLGLIGAYLDIFLYDKIFFLAPLLGLIGAVIGATIGSTGETPERLSSKEGRFELYCILLRGVEVGLIGAAIGAVLGLILLRFSYPFLILFWGIYFGFTLGMMAGSINPPNLTAYASYISASLKNVVIFLLIMGAIILGLVIGIVFADTFKSVFGIIWESLLKIFNG
ncbi:MAG: curved DNA-binding protein [Candidatus Berkelbacteria bacterium Licking1014_96]|uniref:Curved DNA-binding protein n=1 Tax=Candidatus Berkelbacteria bacterium Licking1014_96 TaxID=2017149 RepID=A0A554LDL2_9BACT|nr:MAG: curved DNA-binding protein [Candidatus Berkelbacteria bacterium Licking1014_96]